MEPSQPLQPERLTVGSASAGRLDRVLADWLGLSRGAVLRLLDTGGLTCNGRTMTRKHKGSPLFVGDELVCDGRYAGGETPAPDSALVLEELQQGDGWLVVNKPEGVPVRPHALDEIGTVINALAASHPSIVGVGEGGLRSGVVHRLDTDTSGALLVATESDAWHRLRGAFAEHRVVKRYEALLHGVPEESSSSELHLRVAKHAPAHVEVVEHAVDGDGSRSCSLGWQVLERFGDRACRVEIDLHTGFLHQVRVMMSHLGHPVIGDTQYGEGEDRQLASRQMLHAKSLAYESITAQAPLPADFLAVMDVMRR